MKFILALLLAALALCGSANAATDNTLDLQIRYGHYYVSLLVNENGTSDGLYEWSKTVLKEAALERARREGQVFLGDEQFVQRMQTHIQSGKDDVQIPLAHRRAPPGGPMACCNTIIYKPC